ncbi:hypothetical protein J2X65_003698 [Ancylobacter sp. 3268]|uniref:hypothetical protein n=1 Tax=Ancylobacter sp. 3268 TaxID=2817752 RepID=UPI002856D0E1|nr:hypothetical protein [Ancylobacter sp. 3268]MDR6954328.1 hypothetical protein [Ancylobacter sp. 3268]
MSVALLDVAFFDVTLLAVTAAGGAAFGAADLAAVPLAGETLGAGVVSTLPAVAPPRLAACALAGVAPLPAFDGACAVLADTRLADAGPVAGPAAFGARCVVASVAAGWLAPAAAPAGTLPGFFGAAVFEEEGAAVSVEVSSVAVERAAVRRWLVERSVFRLLTACPRGCVRS